MRTYEGLIEIDLADLWEWVIKNYLPDTGDETAFGVPTVNRSNSTIEIPFAGSSGGSCHPADWAEPPAFLKAWKKE